MNESTFNQPYESPNAVPKNIALSPFGYWPKVHEPLWQRIWKQLV